MSDIAPYAGGRPTKCTPDVSDAFLRAVARGMDYKLACDAVDIDYSTFKRWMQLGEAGEQPYCAFRAAVLCARAERAAHLLDKIEAFAVDDWRAAAWILERTMPEHFAKTPPPDGGQTHLHQHVHIHEVQAVQDLIRAGAVDAEKLAALDADIIARRSEAPKLVVLDEG